MNEKALPPGEQLKALAPGSYTPEDFDGERAEHVADQLNNLRGYLSECRDVHARAALVKKEHPNYHPEHIDAYHLFNDSIYLLNLYVKSGGSQGDWDKFQSSFEKAKGLSTKIMAETSGLHQASVDSEFRKLANALSKIDRILGKQQLTTSWI